ncbi:MAG: DUF1292 domain-containing protein [Firmicutes bacterium]|nr:DUF1292 domain-containing protein [Bacillota bacterium]
MAEERDDIVVLIDENGEEEEFEYIDSIEMKGNEYVVLSPLSEDEEDEDEIYGFEDEIVILKVETNEDGEESYVTIEDENELDEVFEEFKLRMEDDFAFDVDDEDDEDEDYDEE